ncbi:hypothetical protein V7S43_001750 [Phytophthora oleae]|uniref:HAT C-terminal dimerisation domain-containing protein n=1 Tax=Phytophthora oleae TaxID=2107226 RepID=A0ABD3G1N0_9STRA
MKWASVDCSRPELTVTDPASCVFQWKTVTSHALSLHAHREVFTATNAGAVGKEQNATSGAATNFDLVPSADDEKGICGAPIAVSMDEAKPPSTVHEKADKVVEERLQYTVDWVAVAVLQSTHADNIHIMTKDDFTPLLLVRNGVVCWRVQAVCEHVDILRWFREIGAARFPSIAALARVWLGRTPFNPFQERVFSVGGIVMSSLRSRKDNPRAEVQVLLKHKTILVVDSLAGR